jgi:hypothetical protein
MRRSQGARGQVQIREVGRLIMVRRRMLGVLGALTLAAVMGVAANATSKSKIAEPAKGCCCDSCCCDACSCSSAYRDDCCSEPICCGDSCCEDTAIDNVAADKTVKAADLSCCSETGAKTCELKATEVR